MSKRTNNNDDPVDQHVVDKKIKMTIPEHRREELQLVAENGDVDAMMTVAWIYFLFCVFGEALRYYEMAASRGNLTALERQADFYFKGIGVSQDVNKGLQRYGQAADRGSVRAMCRLADIDSNGLDGVTRGLDKARQYYERGADAGDEEAQYNLALFFQGTVPAKQIRTTSDSYNTDSTEANAESEIADVFMALFDEYDATVQCAIKQVNKFDPLNAVVPFEKLRHLKGTSTSEESNEIIQLDDWTISPCEPRIKCYSEIAARMNVEIDQEWGDIAVSMPFRPFSIMPLKTRLELTEQLLQFQDRFRQEGRPCAVDVGYHNTLHFNLPGIKLHGLRNMHDRNSLAVNGKSLAPRQPSEQIFTGNNPYKFRAFGNVGLLVARLKGKTRRNRYPVGDSNSFEFDCGAALETSEQCVAFFYYNVAETRQQINHDSTAGHDAIYYLHCMLQRIIDKYMNDGQSTFIEVCIPEYMGVGHF